MCGPHNEPYVQKYFLSTDGKYRLKTSHVNVVKTTLSFLLVCWKLLLRADDNKEKMKNSPLTYDEDVEGCDDICLSGEPRGEGITAEEIVGDI